MLLKLMKHEFKINRNSFAVLFLALLVLSIVLRISDVTNVTGSTDNVVVGFLSMMYVIGILTSYVYLIIAVVMSFNKSMFKKTGYLTLTLPVSTTMKIAAKVLMASFWFLATSLVIGLSLIILVPNFFSNFQALIETMTNYGLIITALQIISLGIVSIFQNILLLYLCITFVNTKYVKGHRLLIGFGIYFALSYAISLLQNFFSNYSQFGLVQTYYGVETIQFFRNFIQSMFVSQLILGLISGIVCFLLIKYLVEKKIELD